MADERTRRGSRAWFWVRMAAIGVLVAFLFGRQCARVPEAADEAPSAAAGERQIMVEASVAQLDPVAIGTAEGDRLFALDGSSLEQPQDIFPRIDQNSLVTAGMARVIANPRLMIVDGQAAEVEVSFSAPSGAGAPRVSRSERLEIHCTITEDGRIDGRYTLRMSQQTGEFEHAAEEIGIPLGDRVLIDLAGVAADGGTMVGVRELSEGSGLGGAIVLIVSVRVIEPAEADD